MSREQARAKSVSDEGSQSALEQGAWAVAGVVLAGALYFLIPEQGAVSVQPLIDAIVDDRPDVVRRELERGIDPDQPGVSGWMAAHYAAIYGRQEILEAIFDAGGDANVRSTLTGQTPLHRAVFGGQNHLISFLLARGADIDALSYRNETPLLIALSEGQPRATLLLLNSGADVTGAEGKTGRSPLHYAATTGVVALVEGMLDGGADLEARSRTGATPLHDASGGQVSVVRALLARGADPNALDLLGNTPVFEAARFQCRTCADLLIEAGARVSTRNRRGETAADVAERMNFRRFTERLREQIAAEAASGQG